MNNNNFLIVAFSVFSFFFIVGFVVDQHSREAARINSLEKENKALRKENDVLREKLQLYAPFAVPFKVIESGK